MFTLHWPWLLLLLPLPWVVLRLSARGDQREQALRVPLHSRLMRAAGGDDGASQPPPWLLWLVWALLVLACTRPQWMGEETALPITGRDLMLAADISGSMERNDMVIDQQRVTRLIAVKVFMGDFISRRRGDRLGLILFGTQAYLQAPLTFDTRAVRTFLEEAEIGFAGNGTAIGDAIGLAIKKLQERPQQARVLILLTDGANTAGSLAPEQAAQLAARSGLRVYTIGIGAEEMVTPGLFGSSLGARRINPSADLNEALLKNIAEQTGGQYFRARDTAELAEIYRTLDTLEPLASDAATVRPVEEWFHLPLGMALLLSLAGMGLRLRDSSARAAA